MPKTPSYELRKNEPFRASDSERGVALLTVLLLLVFMSSVALAITDDIRFAIRRTANLQMAEQAQWYALGAEELARQVVWRSWKSNPNRSTLNDPWARRAVNFPIDGGNIRGSVTDGGNCFNLNSVVMLTSQGFYVERERGVSQYRNLLEALDTDSDTAASLASALLDWVDSDSVPSPRGAEDGVYARLDPSYRTGGTILAEPTELRAIAGYTEPLYQRIRPFVCAFPDSELSIINVNTLREEDAPLLTMLTGRELRLTEAMRAIARRPSSGFRDIDDFFADESLAGISLDEDTRGQFALRTRYFNFKAHVQFHDAYVQLSSAIEVDHGGGLRTIARRYGAFE